MIIRIATAGSKLAIKEQAIEVNTCTILAIDNGRHFARVRAKGAKGDLLLRVYIKDMSKSGGTKIPGKIEPKAAGWQARQTFWSTHLGCALD